MSSGFDEISLAVFTTLSPAGVLAFVFMALPLLRMDIKSETAEKINRYLAIPFAITLVGFIASATHLGTPANALHVFFGVGRSPLSTEVFTAVLFLLLSGSYWMMAFKESFPSLLAKIWIVCACLAGVAFVVATSLAYEVITVPTWNTLFTPLNLVFAALFAAPFLTLFSNTCASFSSPRYDKVMLIVAGCALLIGTVILFVHEGTLSGISNNETVASSLVPFYFVLICLHFILGSLGLAVASLSLQKGVSRRKVLALRLAACLIVFLSVFVSRISFYSLHMTVGF